MTAQVEEVGASAKSLAEMAETLERLVAQFTVEKSEPARVERGMRYGNGRALSAGQWMR
jgi:hypothetical protein